MSIPKPPYTLTENEQKCWDYTVGVAMRFVKKERTKDELEEEVFKVVWAAMIKESLVAIGLDAVELEAMARMPPEFLLDMRKVYAGTRPETDSQQYLLNLLKTKPGDFLEQFQRAEREYASVVKALERPTPKPVSGVQNCTPEKDDEGQVRVEELIDRILKECQ